MLNFEQRRLLELTASLRTEGKIEQNERESLDRWIISEYQGWANYPTWAVNLWLSHNEPLYREALERTADTIKNPPHVSEHWNDEQTARYNVADMLKEWVTDDLAPDLGASFASDLLGYALGEVDWDEIADAWIEQVSEQVA